MYFREVGFSRDPQLCRCSCAKVTRAISYTRTENSRKRAREAAGLSTSSLRAQIFPTLLPSIHTRLAFVYPPSSPHCELRRRCPSSGIPATKMSPGLLGPLPLRAIPWRIRSRSQRILEAWSNGKRKGSPGRPERVSHVVGYCMRVTWYSGFGRGVRVLFFHKRRIFGGIAHSTPLPRFLGSHNEGAWVGGILTLAIPVCFTLVSVFHFLRPFMPPCPPISMLVVHCVSRHLNHLIN